MHLFLLLSIHYLFWILEKALNGQHEWFVVVYLLLEWGEGNLLVFLNFFYCKGMERSMRCSFQHIFSSSETSNFRIVCEVFIQFQSAQSRHVLP